MIDLHTHMLWGWDDGPDDWPQSLSMLRVAAEDGITAIVLTPHVFRSDRHDGDLTVLGRRMAEFDEAAARSGVPVELHWGAEVAVRPEVVEAIERHRFTIDATRYVFVEFPPAQVTERSKILMARLLRKGLVPIIGHPERNPGFVERPERLYDLVAQGCAVQVTAMSLTGGFGRDAQRAVRLFMNHNLVHIIASDAHGDVLRPPVLSRAAKAAEAIVGPEKAGAMVREIPQAILEDRALPDWGRPTNPFRCRIWLGRRTSVAWLRGRQTGGGAAPGRAQASAIETKSKK